MQAAGDSEHISEKFKKLRLTSDIAQLLTPPQSEEKFIQTTVSSLKTSSSHSDHDSNSTSYVESLKEEREQLSSYTDGLTHVFNLIDKEIDRVVGNDQPNAAKQSVPDGPHVLSEILPVPVDLYPNYNFVGRILGPRGTTAKQLENATGCKIIVHGRKRDGNTATSNDAEPPVQTEEPLRIEVSCPANIPEAAQKLEMGVNVIKALLVPPADGQDELKRQQLMVLANMNGTYRPRSGAAAANISGDYQFQNLLPYGYNLPTADNCNNEMLAKALLSIGLSPATVNKLTNSNGKPSNCYKPECAILRSQINNNLAFGETFMSINHQLGPIPNYEHVLNAFQWYEMMNRLYFPTQSPENMQAQEISNRMCSSMKNFSKNSSKRVEKKK